MTWWEFDFNFWLIRMLALLGLAKDIKLAGGKPALRADASSQRLSA